MSYVQALKMPLASPSTVLPRFVGSNDGKKAKEDNSTDTCARGMFASHALSTCGLTKFCLSYQPYPFNYG